MPFTSSTLALSILLGLLRVLRVGFLFLLLLGRDVRVLVMSYENAASGANLTSANHVLFVQKKMPRLRSVCLTTWE